MARLHFPKTHAARPERRYVRPPQAIAFPEQADVPEGKTHLILRTFLFRLLRFALGPEHSVGSDQFVYWNASNPRRCLSPDVFVKLGCATARLGAGRRGSTGGPRISPSTS